MDKKTMNESDEGAGGQYIMTDSEKKDERDKWKDARRNGNDRARKSRLESGTAR